MEENLVNGDNWDSNCQPPESEARVLLPAGATDTTRLSEGGPENDLGSDRGGDNNDNENKEDEVGLASRRAPAITSKEWAGSAVWARLAKYPWWPAQVLDENDPWIPNDSEVPRHGAIPVRFFGTYDFAWIESHRAICPYDKGHAEHSKQSRQKVFVDAMEEAENFQVTQELPNGFNEDTLPSPPMLLPEKRSRPRSSKPRTKKGQTLGVRGSKKSDGPLSSRRNVRERQDIILRRLALQPPPDSPYLHKLNLDGVKKLLELKEAGLWPPPAPKPAAPAPAQPAYSAGTSLPQSQAASQAAAPAATQAASSAAQAVASHMPYTQSLMQMNGALLAQSQPQAQQVHQYTQLLQQQHLLQQHLQNGAQPWFMQPHLYSPQLGFGYYSNPASGVQGALLAAQQHQLAQKQINQKAADQVRANGDAKPSDSDPQNGVRRSGQPVSEPATDQFLSSSRPLL